MSMLYVMVGLPGSGKSTIAKGMHGVKVVSSDSIREELYGDESIQGNGGVVFSTLFSRVSEELQKGNNVVIDATCTRRKDRVALCKRFSGAASSIVAIYVATPLEECKERNAKRDRVVPEEVIDRMYEALRDKQPILNEGFDSIIMIGRYWKW